MIWFWACAKSGIVEPVTVAPAPVDLLVSAEVVPFDASESMVRLARSEFKVDFFRLANHYESQRNLAMCGPTTSVIVLNALRGDDDSVDKPRDTSQWPQEVAGPLPERFDPIFARYTQASFFDERFASVKDPGVFHGQPDAEGQRDGGLQLRQLAGILEAHDLAVTLRVVDQPDVDTIRNELRGNLGQPDDYVIINYHRPGVDQKGGGHISPLGAYDQGSDSFLILDVNANGRTWVWAPTTKLVAAMNTFDTVENRGYLLVSEETP